jgi:Ca2+-binding RTX toxin-like protein
MARGGWGDDLLAGASLFGGPGDDVLLPESGGKVGGPGHDVLFGGVLATPSRVAAETTSRMETMEMTASREVSARTDSTVAITPMRSPEGLATISSTEAMGSIH